MCTRGIRGSGLCRIRDLTIQVAKCNDHNSTRIVWQILIDGKYLLDISFFQLLISAVIGKSLPREDGEDDSYAAIAEGKITVLDLGSSSSLISTLCTYWTLQP